MKDPSALKALLPAVSSNRSLLLPPDLGMGLQSPPAVTTGDRVASELARPGDLLGVEQEG